MRIFQPFESIYDFLSEFSSIGRVQWLHKITYYYFTNKAKSLKSSDKMRAQLIERDCLPQ